MEEPKPSAAGSYRDAGVDLDAAATLKGRLGALVARTLPEGAVGPGLFSGLLPRPDGSYLAATIDGVGTKTRVASMAGRHRGIGIDIVHHGADDLLAVNARPLLFLDYFGASRLEARLLLELIEGMTAACAATGAALLGGETAQMPGTYADGEYDLVGCMVGSVAAGSLIVGRDVRPGDAVVGFAADGLHTNGYSLARCALFERAGYAIGDRPAALGGASLADALLAPHRWYGPAVDAALGAGRVRAMAHVTGGGIAENLARVLPAGAGAVIGVHGGEAPPLFRLIAEAGAIAEDEMRRVFNLGVGFCVVVPPGDSAPVCRAVRASGTDARAIGEIVAGEGVRWGL